MTEPAPYLSIYTPVRNASGFIESCVRMVAEQGCDSYEHIIVESGSTDNTVQKVRELMKLYPHIRFLQCDRPGQSAAQNEAVRAARGVVIGNVNADDWYEPGLLPRIRGIFEKLPVPSLVAGNCSIRDPDGRQFTLNRPRRMNIYDWLVGPEVHPFPANPVAYFLHRSLHDVAGMFDEAEHYQMDIDFLLRAGMHAHMVHIDELWGNFFMHEDSKTLRNYNRGNSALTRRGIFDRFIATLPFHKRLYVYLHCFWWGRCMRFVRARLLFGLV